MDSAGSSARFRWIKAPTNSELNQLSHTIAHRLARYLERQGLLEGDAEHSTLALDHSDEDPMDHLRGHSITYRVAVGPLQGRKVFTLQTLPGVEEPFSGNADQAAGFSLHTGVAARANQREKVRAGTVREAALGHKLERLCRYITRPAVSEKRLSLTNQGKVRYELKTYRKQIVGLAGVDLQRVLVGGWTDGSQIFIASGEYSGSQTIRWLEVHRRSS